MKRLVCVLLLVCIFMVGCSGAPKRYISPKDAYLATIENKEYILTDALDKLVKLDDETVMWIGTVDSLVQGACILTVICDVKDGKYTIPDTYESNISYIRLSELPLAIYSESRWEHSASDDYDHLWQWVATDNATQTQVRGAVAYDFAFEYAKESYEVTLFTYSIERE